MIARQVDAWLGHKRGGAGINAQTGGSLTITNSTISGNIGSGSPVDSGGGINANRIDLLIITNSTISNNRHTHGGGIDVLAGGGGTLPDSVIFMNNNTISANSADENSGGLRLHLEDLVSFTSVNNTVSGNNAGIEGGGLHITTMDSVVVTLEAIQSQIILVIPRLKLVVYMFLIQVQTTRLM